MAKPTLTAGQLLFLNAQPDQLARFILDHFVQRKVKDFKQENAIRISTLVEKNERIIAEFMELDENGKVKFDIIKVEVPQEVKEPTFAEKITGKVVKPEPKFTDVKQPIFKSGKTEEDYNKAIAELHKQVVPIEL